MKIWDRTTCSSRGSIGQIYNCIAWAWACSSTTGLYIKCEIMSIFEIQSSIKHVPIQPWNIIVKSYSKYSVIFMSLWKYILLCFLYILLYFGIRARFSFELLTNLIFSMPWWLYQGCMRNFFTCDNPYPQEWHTWQ